MTFSAGVVAYGIFDSNVSAATGGGFVALAAAAMMGLAKMRVWAVDTSAERRQLEEALQAARDERIRYVALGVAQQEEHRRCVRDLEAERAGHQRQLAAAKAALEEQFEADREDLIVNATNAAVALAKTGFFDRPIETSEAKILRLPGQQQPVREGAAAHPADEATQPVREREVRHP
ncbi:hypothetical protein [Streptomyces lavendulae]|uniref:hypothetical protein n=1 Tax=Streptomyces lavendulae TaxID=1914 RepID=UPI0033F43B3F